MEWLNHAIALKKSACNQQKPYGSKRRADPAARHAICAGYCIQKYDNSGKSGQETIPGFPKNRTCATMQPDKPTQDTDCLRSHESEEVFSADGYR
jgi:hypothetical protein